MRKFSVPVLCVLWAAMVMADVGPERNGVASSAEESSAGQKSVRKRKSVKRPAKITSRSTYYDRKEGIGVFTGNVHVDDEDYQMHADKVYVFMKGTNELDRIVAVGNVAMTNDAKRAYGSKVSYYRNPGLVVLYSGDGIAAEVRNAAKGGDQIVRGKKIRFWTDSEQVEVLEAEITAPTEGSAGSGLKSVLGR
jgi:lipopolysaccharide transport protein LptA